MKNISKLLAIMLAALLLFSGCGAADQEDSKESGTDMGSQIETVTTDTFSMDYFKFGHGDEAFVILPGLSVQSVMGFASAVEDAYQVLADDYTVYLVDRRKDLPEKYSVHDMAEDTAEALKAMGLGKVNLFGASQGGMMAMDMAVHHPELVENLVLGSTAPCMDEEHYKTIENWISLAKDGDREGLYLAFGEAVYPKEVFEQSRDLLIAAAETVTDEDLERFAILAEGMDGFDVTDKLGSIACPVLVLGSNDDQVVGGEASEKIAELLKDGDCTLYMYDGYGHAAYDTAPDYKERILDFFREKTSDK